jgi:EmrB/QacA subfamily drug resistance transporter
MLERLGRNTIPLIVATALFMANLDATVLSTSLPAIAKDLGLNPIHLKLALTTYLLALAVFIPASGWMADRFGAKTVFRAAIAVFAAGSIWCGFSQGLGSLVAARIPQGMGGAMMVPVGRLVVLRTVPREEMINSIAWLTIPALLGPVLGPLLGGFITTYANWRWIFWINIPVAILGIALVTRFIPQVRDDAPEEFDLRGFLLVGPGLSLFLTGATLTGLDLIPDVDVWALSLAGAVLLVLYVLHAMRDPAPLLDLKLLSIPTFRTGLIGGFLFRVGIGSAPFMIPLLLQNGFGFNPFESGLMTFATGFGAMFMKTQAANILRRWGYSRVLMLNGAIATAFMAVPALFTSGMSPLAITAVFFIGGLSRSLQFTSVNTVAYADVPPEHLSRATSFASVFQELSGAVGVSVAALGLEVMMRLDGTEVTAASQFAPVFLVVALIASTAIAVFATLPADAGATLLGQPGARRKEAVKEASDAVEGHI